MAFSEREEELLRRLLPHVEGLVYVAEAHRELKNYVLHGRREVPDTEPPPAPLEPVASQPQYLDQPEDPPPSLRKSGSPETER